MHLRVGEEEMLQLREGVQAADAAECPLHRVAPLRVARLLLPEAALWGPPLPAGSGWPAGRASWPHWPGSQRHGR